MKEFIVFMAILKGGFGIDDVTYETNFNDWETCKTFQNMVHSKYNEEFTHVTTDCFVVVNKTMSFHIPKTNTSILPERK